MDINKNNLTPFLIYDIPFEYSDNITLYPVKMKDFFSFQQFHPAIILRKNEIFQEKDIIKMEYLEFIKYACRNIELAQKYNMPLLAVSYDYILQFLQIVCGEDAKITYNSETLDFAINDKLITNKIFDDLRKIIIFQNDIDFDMDEFMNIDTVKALEKAREFEAKKNKEKADIEDYIDSLCVSLKVTGNYVSNMSIRKFWRIIKRIQKQEEYQSCHSAEMTGMVTFKEPLRHWMTSIEKIDKYDNLKADEKEVRGKIG